MKIERYTDDTHVFPYIAYIPETLSDHPAVIFQLHGAGERGNGGDELDRVLVHGLCKVATDENLRDCILIMPQCPTDTFWAARVESIKRFVDEMTALYHADNDRLYLCGLSMGGFGTWYTAMAYPSLFAAIAPCCGGGMAWNAGVLTMPIWTFHGLADTVVSPSQTIEMVEVLKHTNPHLKYDLYEGVDHNSWDRAFTPALIEWMLQQHR